MMKMIVFVILGTLVRLVRINVRCVQSIHGAQVHIAFSKVKPKWVQIVAVYHAISVPTMAHVPLVALIIIVQVVPPK
jgi:hypothetical protein